METVDQTPHCKGKRNRTKRMEEHSWKGILKLVAKNSSVAFSSLGETDIDQDTSCYIVS